MGEGRDVAVNPMGEDRGTGDPMEKMVEDMLLGGRGPVPMSGTAEGRGVDSDGYSKQRGKSKP